MMRFGPDRPRRRPNLTPMIDVVFLLLVFFMLVSRFGVDRVLPLSMAGGGGGWSGPPRLVEVVPGGLALNGAPVEADALADALVPLMPGPDAPVVLRARDGAPLQALVAVMETLGAAGFSRLVLVE